MGTARRSCVRAAVLVWMMSAAVSLALPGCQFPKYRFAADVSAGAPAAGISSDPAGAAGDGGANGGGAGAEPLAPCAKQCVPRAPSGGWLGPIAFWEGTAGEVPPDCPVSDDVPVDLHRGLIAPAGTCECTCTAHDQVCDANTMLHIYTDMGCATECAAASPGACDPVSGCSGSQGSMRADAPLPSGGSCKATVSPPSAATWQYDARLCQATVPGTCDGQNQVCAPTPPPRFASQLCVMSVILEGQALPDCPAEYPHPYAPLYETFTDERGCSQCGCGSVTGGTCSGTLLMSSGGDCSSGFEYKLGSGCKQFNLGPGQVMPSHVGGNYTVAPGACSVASTAHPTGSAAPSGRVTLLCCQTAGSGG